MEAYRDIEGGGGLNAQLQLSQRKHHPLFFLGQCDSSNNATLSQSQQQTPTIVEAYLSKSIPFRMDKAQKLKSHFVHTCSCVPQQTLPCRTLYILYDMLPICASKPYTFLGTQAWHLHVIQTCMCKCNMYTSPPNLQAVSYSSNCSAGVL